jgi:hypothetical protein
MIDPHWSVIDLDPVTWRNLGMFFDPGQYLRAAQPGERGLFVLHEDGHVLRVVDSWSGVRRDLDIPDCRQPREVANRLFATGEWMRVHVINKRHLANVARRAQESPRRELTLDGYYHLVYRLLWNDSDGYVAVPPHPGRWHGFTYSGVQKFVGQLPAESSVALGVFDEGAVEIGLVLELRDGQIRRVTTFESLDLPAAPLQVSPELLDQLWSQLGVAFAPPAAVLLCSTAAFGDWLVAEDKTAFLEQAARDGEVFWRLRPADSPQ